MITPNYAPGGCVQKQLRIGKLSDRHFGFEDIDQHHLLAKGYMEWLTEILNADHQE